MGMPGLWETSVRRGGYRAAIQREEAYTLIPKPSRPLLEFFKFPNKKRKVDLAYFFLSIGRAIATIKSKTMIAAKA